MSLLAHVHSRRAGTGEGDHLGTHQGIEEDDVALLEDPMPSAGQEAGVAGAGPHEIDRPGYDACFVHDPRG